MSLRVKLLAMFTLAAVAAIGIMDWGVERYARGQFQEVDQQRSSALVAQFQQELQQRKQEIASDVQGIADAESTTRMVLDLSRPDSDASVYAKDARGLAEAHQLDYLELANNDGTLISVAQWPDQVGYKNDWVTRETDWNQQGAFLDRVELPDGVELGLLAVRVVHVGDQNFYIVGGRRMDRTFLQALELPAGMRALLYRNLEDGFVPATLSSADGPVSSPERFGPLVESLKNPADSRDPASQEQTIQWTGDPVSAEKFVSVPLSGRRGEFLGALLLGSSQSGLVSLENYVRGLALVIAAGTILVGFLMSWWISARVSRPLKRLAIGIDEVAGGDWDTRLEARSRGEIGGLLRRFNRMTDQLGEERTRVLTAERVSAWREMAQQLAGEVQAGIAPLQRAVEKLGQAREQASEQFDDVFSESLATLRVELRILQAAIEGLTDFSRPQAPQFEMVRVNDMLRAAVKSFEPQFCAIGRPPITPELYLDDEVTPVRADPARLKKVIESLLFRALVDMPAGGTLTIRTKQLGNMVHLVIADMGRGFEIENPARIFSMHPAAGSGQRAGSGQTVGEGLILATVQAIVSDHGGRISVESAPGAGTTFYVDLPAAEPVAKISRPRKKQKVAPPKAALQQVEAPAAAIVEPQVDLASDRAPEAASGPTPDPAPKPAAEPIPESIAESAAEPVRELAPETAKEDVSVEPTLKMAADLGAEGRDERPQQAPEAVPAETRREIETEPALQTTEQPAHAEEPFDVLAEITLERQSEFWDGAQEEIPVFAFEGAVVLQESMTAPVPELQEAEAQVSAEGQSRGQSEEKAVAQPETTAQSPAPSLLNALEGILQGAPGERPEKAAEVPAKVLEKEIWRSPLTYR